MNTNSVSFKIDAPAFRAAVKATACIPCGEDYAYPDTCIDIDRQGNLALAHTDSVRLIVADVGPVADCNLRYLLDTHGGSLVVSAAALRQAFAKGFGRGAQLEVTVTNDYVFFLDAHGVQAHVIRSEKSFPDFRKILPKSQSRQVKLRGPELLEAIRGTLPYGRELKDDFHREAIEVDVHPDGLGEGLVDVKPSRTRKIQQHGPYRESSIRGSIEGSIATKTRLGEALRINGRYLLDFLKLSPRTISWGATSSTFPMTLKSPELPGVLYILMPINK